MHIAHANFVEVNNIAPKMQQTARGKEPLIKEGIFCSAFKIHDPQPLVGNHSLATTVLKLLHVIIGISTENYALSLL